MKKKMFWRLLPRSIAFIIMALFTIEAFAVFEKTPETKKTFLLVHGAWLGGWAWERLVPYLTNAGYKVFSPTLTGLGEKANLAKPDIGLNTHVQDILSLLENENLHNVVLVGHSYGGMVITGVADKAAERIAHLVYLDAFIPRDGQSVADIITTESMRRFREGAKAVGQGWGIPPLPVERFGITSKVDIAWVKPKLVPQPIKTFEEPVRLTNPTAAALPRTFIYLKKPAMGTFDGFAKMAQSSKDWRYYEMETGHAAMILEPKKLYKLLIEITEELRIPLR